MLIDACKEYIKKTNRKIFFEYVLLNGQNDSLEHATKLGKLLNNLLCHVNLIPVNPTLRSDFLRSNISDIKNFQKELMTFGVPSTLRMEKGIEVSAGCGQLAKSNSY